MHGSMRRREATTASRANTRRTAGCLPPTLPSDSAPVAVEITRKQSRKAWGDPACPLLRTVRAARVGRSIPAAITDRHTTRDGLTHGKASRTFCA